MTGSSGFHGSAIIRELAARDWTEVIGTSRHSPQSLPEQVTFISADVRDRTAIQAAVRGIDAVIHCAGYIGYDEQLCESINVSGTAALADAASRAGVGTLLYVSTTAVYGRGPHRGVTVEEAVIHPRSALSRTRRDAENIVLGHGGLVVRPGLVVGVGDHWVIPALMTLHRRLDGFVEGGEQLMSTIHIRNLARLIAHVAATGAVPAPNRMVHAADPIPVSVRSIVEAVGSAINTDVSGTNVSRAAATSLIAGVGGSLSQLDMILEDRWYQSSELWKAASLPAPSAFAIQNADSEWYSRLLHASNPMG